MTRIKLEFMRLVLWYIKKNIDYKDDKYLFNDMTKLQNDISDKLEEVKQ